MSALPFLAVWSAEPLPPVLRAFLGELGDRCRLAAYEPLVADSFAAALVVGADRPSSIPDTLPLVCWVSSSAEAERAAAAGAVGILAADPTLADADPRVRLVPDSELGVPGARPVSPQVRARLRAAYGLPEPALAEATAAGVEWCGHPVDLALLDTVLAACSVAVVDGAALIRAAAWGCPMAVRDDVAAAVGLPDGVAVRGAPADLARLAGDLAVDAPGAARVSRLARRWYERRADVRSVAVGVAAQLGLEAHGALRLDHRAAELGGRPSDDVLRRAHERLGAAASEAAS